MVCCKRTISSPTFTFLASTFTTFRLKTGNIRQIAVNILGMQLLNYLHNLCVYRIKRIVRPLIARPTHSILPAPGIWRQWPPCLDLISVWQRVICPPIPSKLRASSASWAFRETKSDDSTSPNSPVMTSNSPHQFAGHHLNIVFLGLQNGKFLFLLLNIFKDFLTVNRIPLDLLV